MDLNEEVSSPSENKILNRKNFFILVGVLTLVGIAVWYYYSNSGTGGAGGLNNVAEVVPANTQTSVSSNAPLPQGTVTTPQTISITDNQTETNRFNLMDRADRLRLSGRISQAEYVQLREGLLPPLPSILVMKDQTLLLLQNL